MRTKILCAIVLSAATILPCCRSRAQDTAAAKAFVESVYRHYQSGGDGIAFSSSWAGHYYDTSLLVLERADATATEPDYIPALSWDPLCSCKNWNEVRNLDIEIHVESPRQMAANVSFAVFDSNNRTDTPRKLEITLLNEYGRWRIDDILDKSDTRFTSSTLRQLLMTDLARLRGQPAPASH